MTKIALFSITFCWLFICLYSASCSSKQYCPSGWTVNRNATDSSPITCDPLSQDRAKCAKPHTCVASRCGLSFCCVNDVTFAKMAEREEMEKENAEQDDDDEENEEL